jgi:hypothetical protein
VRDRLIELPDDTAAAVLAMSRDVVLLEAKFADSRACRDMMRPAVGPTPPILM